MSVNLKVQLVDGEIGTFAQIECVKTDDLLVYTVHVGTRLATDRQLESVIRILTNIAKDLKEARTVEIDAPGPVGKAS